MNEHPNLNRLIDDVGRQMTTAEPSPYLRARVLGRLDNARPRRWMWMLGPLAAGATVVALVATHGVTVAPSAPASALRASAGRPDNALGTPEGRPSAPSAPAAPTAPHGSSAPSARVTPTHPGGPRPSAEEVAWQDRAIPILAAPEMLTLDSIQPEALEIRPLLTTPLTLPALEDSDERR